MTEHSVQKGRNAWIDISVIGAALRAGESVSDVTFDAHLPVRYQAASVVHWTPMQACKDAVEWLAPEPGARVLDVGSGVGKLCLVGALTTPATFVGVEQRPHLVELSRNLAWQLGAKSALFVCKDAFDIDWGDYSSLYFYNPFIEGLFTEDRRIDTAIELSEELHAASVLRLADKLSTLRKGTRVVVYHALGCTFPCGFERVALKRSVHSDLELWRRK
jgi:SAM-dependent methyltransferase